MRPGHLIFLVAIGAGDFFLFGEESSREADRAANAHLVDSARQEVLRLENSIVKSYHEFRAVVERSPLLRIVEKMPKGANLHGYLYGLVSYEYVYNLTWGPDVLACLNDAGAFAFSYGERRGFRCEPIDRLRRSDHGSERLVKALLMVTDEEARDPRESAMLAKYRAVESLVSKRSLLERFVRRMLEEQWRDGISYVEFRSSLAFYDSEARLEYGPLEVAEVYKRAIDGFAAGAPAFAARVVFSPYGTDLYDDPRACVEVVREVAAAYPDLIAGVEFFAPVDVGLLLLLPTSVEVYYHRAKRLRADDFLRADDLPPSRVVSVSEREIVSDRLVGAGSNRTATVLEVCPTSVYFQRHKERLRRSVSGYLAAGRRILICAEYPGFWHVRPLSHDWYLVFLYVVAAPTDVDFFRRIAVNSFVYSNLRAVDKMTAIGRWSAQWNQYKNVLASSPWILYAD